MEKSNPPLTWRALFQFASSESAHCSLSFALSAMGGRTGGLPGTDYKYPALVQVYFFLQYCDSLFSSSFFILLLLLYFYACARMSIQDSTMFDDFVLYPADGDDALPSPLRDMSSLNEKHDAGDTWYPWDLLDFNDFTSPFSDALSSVDTPCSSNDDYSSIGMSRQASKDSSQSQYSIESHSVASPSDMLSVVKPSATPISSSPSDQQDTNVVVNDIHDELTSHRPSYCSCQMERKYINAPKPRRRASKQNRPTYECETCGAKSNTLSEAK